MSAEIENIINEGLNSQVHDLAVNAIISKAGVLTLEKLAGLKDSERFGNVLREVTLQELFDAAGAASKPSKKREKKAPKASGGGGSAKEGQKVNFRDPDEKDRYIQKVTDMIENSAGEPVSTTEIMDACGGSNNQARDIMLGLVEEGKVVSTGKARRTRYFWRAGASAEVIAEHEALVAEQNK